MIRLISSALLLTTIYVSAPLAQVAQLSLDDPKALARAVLPESLNGRAVAGVLREGQRHFAGASGNGPQEFDASTQLFEIGSITKVFTGLLLAQEVERNALSLDTSLEKLLGAHLTFASPNVAAITLKQLVTHSSCLPRLPPNMKDSGLNDPYARYTRTNLHRAISQLKLDKVAPCEFAYSNFGMGLLGDLLAQHASKSYEQLVLENITIPLGMRNTTQKLSEMQGARMASAYSGKIPVAAWNFDALAGAGALRSSAYDLLTFAQALMAGRRGALGMAAERVTQILGSGTGSLGFSALGYALFLGKNDIGPEWNHGGATAGYRTLLVMYPDRQEALVLLASNADASPEQVLLKLGGQSTAALTAITLSEEALKTYRGTFALDGQKNVKLLFVPHGGKLYGRRTNQLFNALTPTGKDTFDFAEVGARFEFARDDKGQINAVTLKQRGNVLIANRTESLSPMTIGPSIDALQVYEGRYLLKRDAVFDIQAANGAVLVKLATQPRLPVYASITTPDRFEAEAVEAAFAFERDANGRVVALVLHQNGVKLRARRIADY
jgi:serine-type D-Ala-D-Ala carboxypeptidase/endopeptidase